MKNEYKKPYSELEEYKAVDIITTSNDENDLNKDDEFNIG